MKKEFSAGGIVFNKQGQVLLVNNRSKSKPTESYWGFPKGHVEAGESTVQAALREVEEETGVKARKVKKVGHLIYFFQKDGHKIHKKVDSYLMEWVSGEIHYQQEELNGAEWLDVEQALDRLSFDNDKMLLKKAMEINGQR